MSDPIIRARSRLGGRIRLGSSPALIEEARQDLVAAKLERAICDALAADPPLADDERKRLGVLLLSGGA